MFYLKRLLPIVFLLLFVAMAWQSMYQRRWTNSALVYKYVIVTPLNLKATNDPEETVRENANASRVEMCQAPFIQGNLQRENYAKITFGEHIMFT